MKIDTVELARQVRLSSLMMVNRAGASHIGSALSIADILAVLYGEVMHFPPREPEARDRDRFILSKGHACVANYAVLAAIGTLVEDQLLTYGQDFSPLMNHISHKVAGVEFSTGALGHGLPFGVGKALAAKCQADSWKTFVLLSDGELGEGSNWEALMFAAHHNLSSLIAIVDYNNLQSLATVDKTVGIEPLADKFQSFGWAVNEVDGHDHDAMIHIFNEVKNYGEKPSVVIAHTTKGKGVSFMENKVEWHYKTPDEIQLKAALEELQIA